MTQLYECPVCGEGHLTPVVDSLRVVLNGNEYEIPSHYAVCNTCHSEVGDADDMAQNKQEMERLRKFVEDGLSANWGNDNE